MYLCQLVLGATTNHIVMTEDGSLVNLVLIHDQDDQEKHQQKNVVNIVTITATNKQGQQIMSSENLDQHFRELQWEIMNALVPVGSHPV